jgi:small subunit ribosomal protein S18
MEEMKNSTPAETSGDSPAPAAPTAFTPARPRGPRPERSGQRRNRFGPRPPKTCPFCAQKVKYIDYKTADQLRRYLTDHGKIKARRKIGTCAKHQRRLALAIKRARHVALLPFTSESTRGE